MIRKLTDEEIVDSYNRAAEAADQNALDEALATGNKLTKLHAVMKARAATLTAEIFKTQAHKRGLWV